MGPHDICFSHTFEGKTFFFKRDAQNASKVLCCGDNKYIPNKEISLDEFCKWLLAKYKLDYSGLTFRQIVGLYIRIWNKPNKEVNRPLYNHNAQTIGDAISKNAIPRARKAASQIQYHVRIGESASG